MGAGRGWYPCCSGCVYFEDDFNRPDSTNLGADWTEVAEDWEIKTNKLQVSDSNAIVTCDETNPDGTAITATCTLKGAAEGDQLRILVDYVDSNNYWFGEIEWGPAGGTGALRLWKRSGGSNSCRGRLPLPAAISTAACDLVVCVGDGTISAKCGTVILTAAHNETTSTMGLATGTVAGAVTFDDLSLEKHEEDDADCPACEDDQCIYFKDDFDRSDGTAIGNDWTETAQDWSIDTDRLKVAAANAVALSNSASADDLLRYTVTVDLTAEDAGDISLVIVDYQDANNYVFAEVTWGAVNSTLKLWKRVAAVNTQMGSSVTLTNYSPGDIIALHVCQGSTRVTASVVSTFPLATSGVWTATVHTVGVGSGGTVNTAIYFDDFEVTRHHEDMDTCFDCARRCAQCTNSTAPRQIMVRLAGVVNDGEVCCGNLNADFILPPYVLWGVEQTCYWYLDFDICEHTSMGLGIVASGFNSILTFNVWGVGCVTIFTKQVVGTFDCMNFDAYNVPYSSSSCGHCDWSGATALIFAL